MEIRPLGETGLVASRIGLGLAALGRPVYIDVGRDRDLGNGRTRAAMEGRCHEVLDAAYAAGIRYVDAARSYGDAEAFVADWLAAGDRRDVVVGSKWGYTYVGGWRLDADVQEVKDLSVAALRRQIAESRRLLGDHLSLYQIHSATIESGVFDDRELLDELRSVRESGLVLGFSTSGPKRPTRSSAASRSGSAANRSSRPFSRPGTCWSHRPAPRWRRLTRTGAAS